MLHRKHKIPNDVVEGVIQRLPREFLMIMEAFDTKFSLIGSLETRERSCFSPWTMIFTCPNIMVMLGKGGSCVNGYLQT